MAELNNLPLQAWNYIDDLENTRHFGPFAEDFYAAYGLGADNLHISPSDLAGIAVGAAQELLEIVETQSAQIDALATAAEISLPQEFTGDTHDWLSGYFSPVLAEARSYPSARAVSAAISEAFPTTNTGETVFYSVLPGAAVVAEDGTTVANGYVLVESTPQIATSRTLAEASSSSRQVLLADRVYNDDLIVDGSACVGFDCVNGESFGSDTLRLKENNVRMVFIDTSSTASFPRRDWQIRANDPSNGGDSFFAIDDLGDSAGNGSSIVGNPFRIEAGAPNHSLFVESTETVLPKS